MLSDLRFAFRSVAKNRLFSTVVIATLAIGIGVNTAVFSLVNAFLFKAAPYPNGERFVMISAAEPHSQRLWGSVSYPDFEDFRDQCSSFVTLEAFTSARFSVSENGGIPDRLPGSHVTSGFFSALEARPVLGRGLLPEDYEPGASSAVLISHTLWASRFGESPDALGKILKIDGRHATIVGVMPKDFNFIDRSDFWMAHQFDPVRDARESAGFNVFGFLKPGISSEAASAEVASVWRALSRDHPRTHRTRDAAVMTLNQTLSRGPTLFMMSLLVGAVGMVMAIVCINVANMILGRSFVRSREMAVRASMGATRWRLVRQLLSESVVLSTLGGVLGLGIAIAGTRVLDAGMVYDGRPYWIEFSMDWRAFAYFAALSVLSGIGFGLAPAMITSRVDISSGLKAGAQGTERRAGRLTAVLVTMQVAMTVVLLSAAGLMLRSVLAIESANPFVPADRLLTGELSLSGGKGERYENAHVRDQFIEELQGRLARMPGATHSVIASSLPGIVRTPRVMIEAENTQPVETRYGNRADAVYTTSDYFAAINLPVQSGRQFDSLDGQPGRESAVVTSEFARKFWPDQSPVGRRFRIADSKATNPWITVIGVSNDMQSNIGYSLNPPLFFLPVRQQPPAALHLIVRTSGNPADLAGLMRQAVHELDPQLSPTEVNTLAAHVAKLAPTARRLGPLFQSFSAIALLIASIGLYGIVAYSTAQRTREIGIRLSLGATAGHVIRLVMRRAVAPMAVGLVLGVGCAFMVTRHLLPFIKSVPGGDPLTLTVSAAMLTVVGVLACWLPARRAALVQPTEALRAE